MNRIRYSMFVATLFIVLALSAVSAVPVLADDDPPPPVEPAADVVDPPLMDESEAGENDSPVSEPADAGLVVEETEAFSTDEAGQVEEIEMPSTDVGEQVDDETSGILSQLPEGTELVVLDENGERIPLASQEAVAIIAGADPIWCPASVTTPAPGVSGCTDPGIGNVNYDPTQLSSLLTYLTSNQPGVAGVIWIEKGYDSSLTDGAATSYVLDGSVLTNMANFAITIKGGWNGLGTGTVDTTDPSEINVPLSIINWNADVTLSDLLITGVTNPVSTALTVSTTKNITMDRIDVSDNQGFGADADNTGGTGNVTVTSSKFNNNTNGSGLVVNSTGTITLNSIQANNNGYSGAKLDNHLAVTPMGVTINNSEFNGNAEIDDNLVAQLGLEVYSKGVITISNLDANYNGNGDLDVDDGGAWLDNTTGTAGVTLLGVNIVSSNEWGLGIFTNGAVVLNNMVNNNNSNGSGLYVDNCGWDGSACTSAIVAPISILGTNEFKFNVRGIHMTTNGAITLNNITANNNFGNCQQCGGIYLWNANSSTSANVTLTGINTFRENSMTGLQVYSKGVVTLNNITANNNGWYDSDNLSPTFDQYFGNGAYIDNTFASTPKAVTLAGLSNTFMENATTGLVILSKGAITAATLNASGNGWVDPADADPADSSHGDGAFLDNCLYSDNSTPLDSSDDYCSNPVPASFVKLTGTNTFNNNGWGDGLEIGTLGVITVNNLSAYGNGSQGAYLYNNLEYWNAPTSAYKYSYNGVTITGYANTENNGFRGMSIYSAGVISVTNANASNNGGIGLRLYNIMDPAQPKAISLLGTNVFNGNWQDGLKITSYGAVTTNNVSARWNGHYDDSVDTYYGYGAFIDNCGWNGTACNGSSPVSAVTMNGTNVFWSNNLSGLEVYSKGAIKVNQITSNYNGWVDWNNEDYWDHDSDINTPDIPNTDSVYGYGAFLYNRDGLAAVTITGVNGAYFESNWNTGLHIESRGAIAVDKLTSIWNGQEDGLVNNEDPFDDNDANGAYLDNMWLGAVGDVTITGYARTEGNLEYGLEIYSNGNIKLTSVTANNNDFKGLHAENATLPTTTPKTVSILGTNNFNGNGAHGLVIKSYGVITLNNINAGWNGGFYNAYIDNCQFGITGCTALTQAAVTMTGTNNFDGNWGGGGLYVSSFGKITIANLSVSNNDGNGAYIDNQFFNEALTPVASLGTITITGYADFYNNGFDGLYAYSNGKITIANLSASNNGGDGFVGGAYLSAQKPGLGTANVVLTGYNNFNQNYGGDGLTVFADGAITIANLTANENWDGSGAYLDNRVSTTLPMAVTLTGFNNFWHNYLNGLTILSYGAVTVNNIDASDNGIDETWSNAAGPEFGWGLYIDNRNLAAPSAKSVTLTGFNNFYSNWNSGLEIWSSNLVTLSNVMANYNGNYYDDLYSYAGANGTYVGCGDQTIDNGDYDFYVGCGAYIDNSSAAAPMNVVLLGVNEFNNTTHHGLKINSKGQLLLSNITANWNGWYYDGIDTNPDTVFGSGAYLLSTMKGITFTGTNTFDGNWDDGLFTQALDLIKVNNLIANNNGGTGAYLDNLWDVKHSDIVVTGHAYASGNGLDGITIFTNGSATLANVGVSSNAGNGLYVEAYDNNSAPLGKPSNVTITGTNWFWGNGVDGLAVLADGVITLNNINASHNGNNGATIDGISAGYWMPLPAVRLNITGTNNFNSNGNIGLFFDTFGNVTLTRVTADNNSGTGVVGTTTGNITYTCGSVTRNAFLGYDLTATGGTLTLAGVSSTGNLGNSTIASTIVRVRTCPLP